MKTIHKYPIEINDKVSVEMPEGAVVLSAQYQGLHLCLWAAVDADRPMENRGFRIFGTGQPMPPEWDHYVDEAFTWAAPPKFIATVQHPTMPLIWHIFGEAR